MISPEDSSIAGTELDGSAKARYLSAKQMFQSVDDSDRPNSQELIDEHERWLSRELGNIGIEAQQENLYVIFRDGKLKDKKDKPAFRRIETQVRASANNILQGLLWYEAPEFASWEQARIKFVSPNAIADQSEVVGHMQRRKARGGWRISNWNSPENYKSLIVGYYPPEQQNAPFTFEVNEHYPGVEGSFDFTDSKRKHTGVKAYFDPDTQLFEVSFEGYSDFIGWDQPKGEKPIYRLTYVRDMVRDLYSRVKSGETGFIQIAKWSAY